MGYAFPEYSAAELEKFALANSRWRPASGLQNGRWRVVCEYRFDGVKMPGGQIFFELEDCAGRPLTFVRYESAKRVADRYNALCAFIPESDHGLL